jgi:polyphosphate kinase
MKYKFFNRELSWLSFNHRVLQEANDPNVPLHEKIKFMAIFSSNLDEFFRVRVANLRYLLTLKRKTQEKLKIDPEGLLKDIHDMVDKQQQELGNIFRNTILPELKRNNIVLTDGESLNKEQLSFVNDYFRFEIRPHLRPSILVRNKITIFLQNQAIYFAIRLHSKNTRKNQSKKATRSTYAIVEIPTMHLPRFIEIPGTEDQRIIIFLDDILRKFLDKIFPGYKVKEVFSIKLTRDAEMYIDDEFEGDLLDKIKKGISKRKTGTPSRFLYDQKMPPDFLRFLRNAFMLQKEDLIPGGRYHNFSDFISFPRIGPTSLQDKKLPSIHLKKIDNASSIVSQIRKKDILLFYPYHTYDYVLRFLKEAADDPLVQSLYVTLYRGAADSLVIKHLIRAGKAGKLVTVFVEVKARFDEESNIMWAQALKDTGIKVLYSFPGLKVHSKLALITRKEGSGLKHYAYLASGNFNEKTAKLYSDFGLFTCNNQITREVKQVFDYLNKGERKYNFRYLLVAPFTMRDKFYEMIEIETENARLGKEARIDVKLNSLEDKKIIEKLYQASIAGVKIRIIVRGICCLVPGIKNMSENIEVISILDRFLEHARIYIFHNKGKEKFYLASADWMRRNLSRRIEVAFPIYDANAKLIIREIFELQWRDNQKARQIDEYQQNNYIKKESESPLRSQMAIYELLRTS